MTAIAHDDDKIREIDAGTVRAWTAYSETLRGLHGEEYERVEQESWVQLQSELRRLQRRRQLLSYASA